MKENFGTFHVETTINEIEAAELLTKYTTIGKMNKKKVYKFYLPF